MPASNSEKPPTPAPTKATGQKRSQERGSATNHKKNPGKLPSLGGN